METIGIRFAANPLSKTSEWRRTGCALLGGPVLLYMVPDAADGAVDFS